MILRKNLIAMQSFIKPVAEYMFLFFRNIFIIKQIIAIRIYHAICKNSRGNLYRQSHHQLKPIHDPNISQSLVNIFNREFRPKLSCLIKEIFRDISEITRKNYLEMF